MPKPVKNLQILVKIGGFVNRWRLHRVVSGSFPLKNATILPILP
jgi:hypothetical protein